MVRRKICPPIRDLATEGAGPCCFSAASFPVA
jgi:hypothetical protein